VALYVLDWDNQNRNETVQILDANNPSTVLDTRRIPNSNMESTSTNFLNGTYLVWNIAGHVTINVIATPIRTVLSRESSSADRAKPPQPSRVQILVPSQWELRELSR